LSIEKSVPHYTANKFPGMNFSFGGSDLSLQCQPEGNAFGIEKYTSFTDRKLLEESYKSNRKVVG
jgi:hypothetical protein